MRNMAILVLASLTLVFTACGNQGVNDSLPSELQTQSLLGASGSLDSSFGTGGLTIPGGSYSAGLTIQGDGKALVLTGSGRFNFPAGLVTTLTRFTRNGQSDPNFGQNGVVNIDGGNGALALVCPNGANAYNDWGAACEDPERTVVAVTVTTRDVPAQQYLKFYRFLPSGQPDPSFGQNGVVIAPSTWLSYVASMVIQADGKMVVGGYLLDGTGLGYLARLKRNGTPDPTFGSGGMTLLSPDLTVIKIVLPQNEHPVVLTTNNVQLRADILGFTDQGLPDTHFGTGGLVSLEFGPYGYAFDMLALDNDHLVVGGSGALWQLRPNGTPDPSFGVNGKASFPDLEMISLALDDQNRLVAGVVTRVGGNVATIARFRPNGVLDSSFGTGGLTQVANPFGGRGDT